MRAAAREDIRHFVEADINGDRKLGLAEFIDMQPCRIKDRHSVEDIKTWFAAADMNRDGSIDVSDFFLWSIGKNLYPEGSGNNALAVRCILA